jgi:putative ABC transport system substrate-binding protein
MSPYGPERRFHRLTMLTTATLAVHSTHYGGAITGALKIMFCPEPLGAAMRRRDFIRIFAGATAWPLAARAQQPATPVIGFFTFVPVGVPTSQPVLAAFRLGLTEAGYTEGKNVRLEFRDANFKPELLLPAARDLVRLNVDVIVAPGGPELVAAAREATSSIPIVAHDLESDPLANGWVKSLARPGGNMTGFFLDIPEMSGKQLALLREVLPRLSRLAILGVPGLNAVQFAATEAAAKAVGVEAEILEVRSPDDFEGAVETARTRHADAGILLSSPLVYGQLKQIAELALAKRLPLICLFPAFSKLGGLMAYGPNMEDEWRRCAGYVGRILHGAKPSDLPIQRPERFDLVINLKTAAALGFSVPTLLLATASEVIE